MINDYYSWVPHVLIRLLHRRPLGSLKPGSAIATLALIGMLTLTVAAQSQREEVSLPSIFPLNHEWVSLLPFPPTQAPTTDGAYLYIPLRGDLLAAVFVADGIMQWLVDQPADFPPTVGGQLLFVADDRRVHALWSTFGIELWQLTFSAPISSPLLWESGLLIVGLANGEVLAYDTQTQRPVWTQQLAAGVLLPTIDDGRLFVPQADGHISSLDLATGSLLWERELGGAPTRIRAYHDRLYVGSTDNFLYAIDRRDGRIRWRWRTGADIIGAPVVTSEAILFVSLDNQLRALAGRTGVQLWKQRLPTRPVGGLIQFGEILMLPGRTPPVHLFYLDNGELAGQILVDADLTLPVNRVEVDQAPELEDDQATDIEADQATDENTNDLSEQISANVELAFPPTVVRANDVDDVAFVLVTAAGEVHAYASAYGLTLETPLLIPGEDPTTLPLTTLNYVPGWPAASRVGPMRELSPLPGWQELRAVDLAPLTPLPGRRFVPPLTHGLTIIPGRRFWRFRLAPAASLPGRSFSLPAAPRLTPLDPLPGVSIAIDGMVRFTVPKPGFI